MKTEDYWMKVSITIKLSGGGARTMPRSASARFPPSTQVSGSAFFAV